MSFASAVRRRVISKRWGFVMKKFLAAVAATFLLASPASATLKIVDLGSGIGGINAGNSFATGIANFFGVTVGEVKFISGFDLFANQSGSIQFTAVGSEGSFDDSFQVSGATTFSESTFSIPAPLTGALNLPGTPAGILNVAANQQLGVGDVSFSTAGGVDGAAIVPPGTFGPGTSQFGAFFVGDPNSVQTVIFGFDDNGANVDDNHDDLLIVASYVPEPSTWLMMIAGFGLIAMHLKARRRNAAATVA